MSLVGGFGGGQVFLGGGFVVAEYERRQLGAVERIARRLGWRSPLEPIALVASREVLVLHEDVEVALDLIDVDA